MPEQPVQEERFAGTLTNAELKYPLTFIHMQKGVRFGIGHGLYSVVRIMMMCQIMIQCIMGYHDWFYIVGHNGFEGMKFQSYQNLVRRWTDILTNIIHRCYQQMGRQLSSYLAQLDTLSLIRKKWRMLIPVWYICSICYWDSLSFGFVAAQVMCRQFITTLYYTILFVYVMM